MIKHLNRIYKLGYDIEVIWNKQIQITYDFNRISGFEEIYNPYEPVSVLIYVHDFWDESLNFQKCLEETCEIFYSWYSDNHKIILKYLENRLKYLDPNFSKNLTFFLAFKLLDYYY
jgi:hypothetical protein